MDSSGTGTGDRKKSSLALSLHCSAHDDKRGQCRQGTEEDKMSSFGRVAGLCHDRLIYASGHAIWSFGQSDLVSPPAGKAKGNGMENFMAKLKRMLPGLPSLTWVDVIHPVCLGSQDDRSLLAR